MTLALHTPYDTAAPTRLRLVAPEPEPRTTPAATPGPAAFARHSGAPNTVSVLRAPAGPESLAPVRLTRRGVVLLIAVVLALGAVMIAVAAASAGSPTAVRAVPATVVVHSGDTVWSIASRYSADDPGALVERIQQRNHLRDAQLEPGQVLRLR